MGQLDQKVVIVAGADTGIGWAFVLAFVQGGMCMMRNSDEL